MGVDFVTTCTPTFERGWDIGLSDARTADLFSDLPNESTRTCRATPTGGVAVAVGDTIFLRPCGGEVSVIRGRSEVGRIGSPPTTLLDRIATTGRGVATGTVTRVFPRSGDFEVCVN